MKHFFGKKANLGIFAAVLSTFTLLAYHVPFFSYVSEHVESGANGVIIIISLVLIMLIANFFAYTLILFTGRSVGKVIIGITFICNALTLYFINTYDVMIDDTMMGNVFNTNYSEATSYWSIEALWYLLLAGVLPCIYLFARKVDYGHAKGFFIKIGASLGALLVIVFGNMSNWMWIDHNSTVIGSLLMPWSYTVNAVRFQSQQHENNKEEILLPDASIQNTRKDVVVLMIGESSRRDHYSLYGYGRQTNPLLSKRNDIRAYKANSAATYTTAGVKAILDHKPTDKLYEILPNYLYRNGVDVQWRANNWGQSPLHIEKYYEAAALGEKYGVNSEYDGVLLAGLKEEILSSEKNKVLIVLHTSSSHGPTYNKKYPPEFEKFSPVSETVEMSKCPHEELVNAYDNTIVYTDYLIDSLISDLEALKDWRSCVIFVSDHGESLGEGNLYMHGVPISIAPAEQYEIPFIVWTSDNTALKDSELLSQYNVFHTVLDFLSVSSPVYDPSMSIFAH